MNQPRALRAPHLGRNVGLGRHFLRPPGPLSVRLATARSWPLTSIRRSRVDLGGTKPPRYPVALTLASFGSFPSLLFFLAARVTPAAAMVAVGTVEGEHRRSKSGRLPLLLSFLSFPAPFPSSFYFFLPRFFPFSCRSRDERANGGGRGYRSRKREGSATSEPLAGARTPLWKSAPPSRGLRVAPCLSSPRVLRRVGRIDAAPSRVLANGGAVVFPRDGGFLSPARRWWWGDQGGSLFIYLIFCGLRVRVSFGIYRIKIRTNFFFLQLGF
jgi:hypothetical protein